MPWGTLKTVNLYRMVPHGLCVAEFHLLRSYLQDGQDTSPVSNISIFSLPAGASISAMGPNIIDTMLSGTDIQVSVAPRVVRHGFREIGASPIRNTRRSLNQGSQAHLRRRKTTDIQSVGNQCFLERIDLRFGDFDFGLGNNAKVLRCNVTGEQANDDHHNQQFEQGETSNDTWP